MLQVVKVTVFAVALPSRLVQLDATAKAHADDMIHASHASMIHGGGVDKSLPRLVHECLQCSDPDAGKRVV